MIRPIYWSAKSPQQNQAVTADLEAAANSTGREGLPGPEERCPGSLESNRIAAPETEQLACQERMLR